MELRQLGSGRILLVVGGPGRGWVLSLAPPLFSLAPPPASPPPPPATGNGERITDDRECLFVLPPPPECMDTGRPSFTEPSRRTQLSLSEDVLVTMVSMGSTAGDGEAGWGVTSRLKGSEVMEFAVGEAGMALSRALR